MQNNHPFVSVVISTRNRKESLEKYSLPSVLNLAYPNYEVIFVVDDSTDGTETFLKDYPDTSGRLKIIKNSRANGIAHARNLCAYYAQGEIVAFTDDDCSVDINWLSEIVEVFLENKSLMVVGGFTVDGHSGYPADGIFGFNMAFRKMIFDRFSFDTNFFFHKGIAHEETDLVNRIKEHKYLTGHAPLARVKHFYSPAAYRKINQKIGFHLNYVYMEAKKIGLARYYLKFFKRSHQMFRKIKQLYREGTFTFIAAWLKVYWANYILLIDLPLKAQIAHMQEEKIFRLKCGANKNNKIIEKFSSRLQ